MAINKIKIRQQNISSLYIQAKPSHTVCHNGGHSIIKQIAVYFLNQQNMDPVSDSTIIKFLNLMLN